MVINLARAGFRRATVVVLCATVPWMVCIGAFAQAPPPVLRIMANRVQVIGQAQVAGRSGDKSKDPPAENVFIQPDRVLLRHLSSARKLIAQDRYAEASRHLGAILEAPEDYFYQPDRDVPHHRSLKAEANRLIGGMPRRGRELYELQYGARARRMVAEAAETGDAATLAEVARRFFHTEAGYEATLLLGLYHLDHSRPLAAALTLERLRREANVADRFEPTLSLATATCWLQAGMPGNAEQVMRALRQRHPDAVRVGDEDVPLFDAKTEPVDWLIERIGVRRLAAAAELDEWTMVRGNPSRTASTSGSAPLLNTIWRVPVSDHPLTQWILASQSRLYGELNTPILTQLHCLAIDDIVLMRSVRTLLAVDFQTGKRLWEIPVDDPMEEFPEAYRKAFPEPRQLAVALCQRTWKDGIYCTFSSDARLVFTIEDLGLGAYRYGPQWMMLAAVRVKNPAWPRDCNRLAAHDIHTGKLVWHIGGSAEESELPEAGAFFLGPPLPLAGRLYQLAETNGEIRLFVLDARTGAVLWSQQLAVVERKISNDSLRRLTAVSPSYADGILVCPTGNGAVVAVELATRSLLWGYCYSRGTTSLRRRLIIRVGGFTPGNDLSAHWSDGNAILADGRVFLTPAGSQELHCISLIDGKLLWKAPRQNDLHVACTYEDKIVLVGPREIRALNLADGKPAWDGRAVLLQHVPSGRGFAAGNLYYQPLSSAEVLTLDLRNGRINRIAKSRDGTVPGNLICYRDKVISQRLDSLEVFHQLDALAEQVGKTLDRRPDDPVALTQRGEILIDQGKRVEALDTFRRSLKLASDPKTRRLLRETLLDGLHDEFATYRTCADEIERLLDEPRQRARYHRLMALGLENQKQWKAALEQYWNLVKLDRSDRTLEQISPSRSVRLDRWIRGRLAELYESALHESAPPEIAAEIDRVARSRLDAAVKSDEIGPLARFVDCFGFHSTAEQAREQLIDRYVKSNRLLEAEMLLQRRARTSNAEVAAAVVAEVAAMLRRAKRPQDAAACYRRLESEYAETVCADGKTGRQFIDALPADDPVRKWIHPDRLWPVGEVKVTKSTLKERPRRYTNQSRLGYSGDRRPFFSHRAVSYDRHLRHVVIRDALGKERWQIKIGEQNRQFSPFNPGITRAAFNGHLLMLSAPFNFVAIDMLGDGAPRLLWNQRSSETISDYLMSEEVQLANMMMWNRPLVQVMQRHGQNFGSSEAFTDDYFCCRRFRNCVAIDPLNGETLWTHRIEQENKPKGNAPGGMRQVAIFGDDQYIFIVPRDETEATVLRAVDGTVLPSRHVPPSKHRVATIGRKVLVWRSLGNKRILEMSDPWEERIVWGPHTFAANAKIARVGHEVVGVMEPGGRFALFSIDDGRKLADTKLTAEPTLQEIVLLDLGDRYILVTNAPPRRRRGPSPRPIHRTVSRRIYKGRVYAFDRQGKRLWPEVPDGVVIENQHILLDQPGRLPVVAFGSMTYERKNNRSRWITSVVLIDKRNGRIVLSEKFPNQTNNFAITGDLEKKTVNLQFEQNLIALNFTDNPLPPKPEPAKKPAPKSFLPKTLDAIRRALL